MACDDGTVLVRRDVVYTLAPALVGALLPGASRRALAVVAAAGAAHVCCAHLSRDAAPAASPMGPRR